MRAAPVDVALQQGGVFQGTVVGAAGAPLRGTKVVVLKQNAAVAETITDEQGRFAVSQPYPYMHKKSRWPSG